MHYFLVIFIGLWFFCNPVFAAEECDPDFSLVPTCTEVEIHYQYRDCPESCIEWYWNSRGKRVCRGYVKLFCANDAGKYVVPYEQAPWTDAVIDKSHFDLGGYSPVSPFRLYSHSYGSDRPNSIWLSETGARWCPNKPPSVNGQNQFLIDGDANEFRITSVFAYEPATRGKLDLCTGKILPPGSDDDECSLDNLNCIKNTLNSVFPFDIFALPNFSVVCPILVFFGHPWDLCWVYEIVKFIKYPILISLAIKMWMAL